ncbi:MAG: hypothetical protein KDC61_05210 [Saprospiraceae bacterium]|nr:hypothetical protein [Saprospiraceae bacterium]
MQWFPALMSEQVKGLFSRHSRNQYGNASLAQKMLIFLSIVAGIPRKLPC